MKRECVRASWFIENLWMDLGFAVGTVDSKVTIFTK
jgi:hypothetical protein